MKSNAKSVKVRQNILDTIKLHLIIFTLQDTSNSFQVEMSLQLCHCTKLHHNYVAQPYLKVIVLQ